MINQRQYAPNVVIRQARRRRLAAPTRMPRQYRRTNLGTQNTQEPFAPPEDWHEPTGDAKDYRIAVQPPGEGYRHVVTGQQIRDRLNAAPAPFVNGLEVVQLSRVTRKKQSFPCYGMQWGPAIYLYPVEETLEEYFYTPPRPQVINEAKMYGGRWDEPSVGIWRLRWTDATIQDFYLNNILLHELGHLVDDRNTNYVDRERYAEWFAIQYGYLASGGKAARSPVRHATKVRRRHHKS